MKKIFPIMVLFFSFDTYAARSPFGTALETYTDVHPYLVGAADAWASVVAGMGPSGNVVRRMTEAYNANIPIFRDVMSIVAYNETPLIIFEAMQHTDAAFSNISAPMKSRRMDCVWENGKCGALRQSLVIDGQVFGSIASYGSKINGDFDTQTGGFTIAAKGYVSEGMSIGIGYTRSTTDNKDNPVYTETTSNSVTAFGQYLSKGGVFVNGGVNMGHTSWTTDKSNVGIQIPQDYDSDFLAAQLTGGIEIPRGPVFIIPQFGMRYTYLTTDKHTDAAVQTFKEWNYNTLSGIAGVHFGIEFLGSDFSVQPNVLLGGSYDMLSGGDDSVHVQLINGSTYFIPVDVPDKAAFNTGVGITFNAPKFRAILNYRLDIRKDFTAHTAMANLQLSF